MADIEHNEPAVGGERPERYELIERIAVGGMAEVYRAVAYGDHGFEKSLAIKRILPELARDREFENRFIGEAKLAVRLSHANVVQVLDFGRLAGTLFIAMELVDGLDLAELLRRYRERGELIPMPAAFHIAVEIARGLDFAHHHGVVHRDVSPSNILLSRAGEVKIADFGIALAVSDRPAAASDKRRIMGKWRYMSPEQTRGGSLDVRSDIFSAAAVWFEIFTGDKLFPGDDAQAISGNISKMEIPQPSVVRPGLPPKLDQLLAAALERDPASRPSAAHLLRGLVELSYEASIVASALDVREAVAHVLPPRSDGDSGPAPTLGFDDLIRAQLERPQDGTDEVVVRRTAVGEAPNPSNGEGGGLTEGALASGDEATGLSIVRRGTGPDGVTQWEMDQETVAARPTALRGKRSSGAEKAERGDEGEEREAGAASLRAAGRAKVAPKAAGRRVWRYAFPLVAAAIGGALVLGWQVLSAAPEGGVDERGRAGLEQGAGGEGGRAEGREPLASEGGGTGGGGDRAQGAAGSDAAVATLVITSQPPGATIALDGAQLGVVTPTSVELGGGAAPHQVELSLSGYDIWQQQVEVQAGARRQLDAQLVAARAALEVTSEPSGATVVLEGQTVGTTPFVGADLAPNPRAKLILRKTGFKPLTVTIALLPGERTFLERTLERAIVYGRINIAIKDSWADVFLGAKPIGRAPGTLRLPIGTHQIRLYNKVSAKERTVTVTVAEDTTRIYEFAL